MKYTQIAPNITDNYLDNLLISRGISDLHNFKYPNQESEIGYDSFHNMKDAVTEICNCLSGKIALIVDSDCDGYTSAAIMYQYLKDVEPAADITYFLHDGKQHGLSDMIENVSKDFDLIIIPDASSNDYELHKELCESGVKIVILDHHEAEHESPFACVVNNQICDYANKELTGAGVVYKFCRAFDKIYGYDFSYRYIDLAAIGIIGDMSTILNPETRYIISSGLNNITNPFINALIEKQAYSIGGGPITPTVVSFYLVPLINALIRVGKAAEKEAMFRAFIEGHKMVQSTKRGAKEGQFESLAQQAARTCVNARSRQNRQKEKALDSLIMEVEKNSLNDNKIIIVPIEDDSIDTTLTGLIAMALVSKYKKPVLLGRETTDGFLRGSVRGPDKTELTDVRQFLVDSGYFEYAEGHALACGWSMPAKNLDKFTAYANRELEHIDFHEGVYQVDFVREANAADLPDLIMDIGSGANLWTQGNTEPYIVVKNIILHPSEIQVMGGNKDSVKFSAAGVDFVKFKDADFVDTLKSMHEISITVIGRANINTFMGNTTPQFFIEDYEIRDSYYDF